eukprot:g1889.t1
MDNDYEYDDENILTRKNDKVSRFLRPFTQAADELRSRHATYSDDILFVHVFSDISPGALNYLQLKSSPKYLPTIRIMTNMQKQQTTEHSSSGTSKKDSGDNKVPSSDPFTRLFTCNNASNILRSLLINSEEETIHQFGGGNNNNRVVGTHEQQEEETSSSIFGSTPRSTKKKRAGPGGGVGIFHLLEASIDVCVHTIKDGTLDEIEKEMYFEASPNFGDALLSQKSQLLTTTSSSSDGGSTSSLTTRPSRDPDSHALILTATDFKAVVLEPSVDTILYIFSSDCNDCHFFKQAYWDPFVKLLLTSGGDKVLDEREGDEVLDETIMSFQLAQMDGVANEVQGLHYESFPCVMFFPGTSGGKNTPDHMEFFIDYKYLEERSGRDRELDFNPMTGEETLKGKEEEWKEKGDDGNLVKKKKEKEDKDYFNEFTKDLLAFASKYSGLRSSKERFQNLLTASKKIPFAEMRRKRRRRTNPSSSEGSFPSTQRSTTQRSGKGESRTEGSRTEGSRTEGSRTEESSSETMSSSVFVSQAIFGEDGQQDHITYEDDDEL